MTQRSASPQLRALGPDIRLLAVFIDAIAAYGQDCLEVQARVDSAMLAERRDGEGWNEDAAQRTLRSRGWNDAEGIYNAAGIPDKHRRVVDLALWREGMPTSQRKGYFTIREISDLTGHPMRTVKQWLHDDIRKLRQLENTA